MAYSPRTIQRAMRGFLRALNTTTSAYDLSTNLQARMGDDRIQTGRPIMVPTAINQFPAVFIYPERETEAFAELGGISAREHQIFRLVIEAYSRLQPVVPSSSNYDNAADAAERENMLLSENVRNALRTDLKLSNTAGLMFGHIVGAEYNVIPPTAEQNTYIFGIKMVWEAESLTN